MSRKRFWIFWPLMVVLACQLPGAVTQRIAPDGRATAPASETGAQSTRVFATVAGAAAATGEGAYTEPSTAEPAYPGDPSSGAPANSTVAASPDGTASGVVVSPPVEQETSTPPALAIPQIPPGEPSYPAAGLQTTQPGAPGEAAYPSDSEPPALIQPGEGAYPPGQLTAPPPENPAVTATGPRPPLPGEDTPAPPVGGGVTPGVPPGRTPGGATAVFSTAPPTNPQATSTLLPSPTRYVPPAVQSSATPTPTRTLLPPPPWVRVPLQATDPRTVRLASGKVQLVEFFAFWSGPSQAMAPLVHALEEAYASQVNFVYLDIDDPDVAAFERELRFRVEPHFFLLDPQGRVLRQWTGYVTTEALQAAIEEALQTR